MSVSAHQKKMPVTEEQAQYLLLQDITSKMGLELYAALCHAVWAAVENKRIGIRHINATYIDDTANNGTYRCFAYKPGGEQVITITVDARKAMSTIQIQSPYGSLACGPSQKEEAKRLIEQVILLATSS